MCQENSVAFIDLETTGLSSEYDEIIEIGAIILNLETREQKEFVTFVSPEFGVPEEATEINGIRNEDLIGAPELNEALRCFADFVQDSPLVAYNARFERRFLAQASRTTGIELLNDFFCAHQFCKINLPNLDRYRLIDVCEHLGVPSSGAHRALADAQMTSAVINALGYLNVGLLDAFRALGERVAQGTAIRQKKVKSRVPPLPNPTGRFAGEELVITGEFALPQSEVEDLAAELGFTVAPGAPRKSTTLLVVSNSDFRCGYVSGKQRKALELRAKGCPIKIISEGIFFSAYIDAEQGLAKRTECS